MSLEIGDQVAHVKSVSSGRVIVDFNHALAGRSLEYNLTVVSEITDPAEKIRALFELHLGIFDELKHKISVEDNVATIILEGVKPGVEEVVQQLLRKDIEKYVPEIEKVSFGDEPEEEPEPSEDAESDNESESTD
jgi:peptidylprolyl isomerase